MRYPWDKWFGNPKRWFCIRRGVDFDCPLKSMAQQVRNTALLKGVSVSISTRGDELLVVIRER